MILTNHATSPISASQSPPSPPPVIPANGLSRIHPDPGKDPSFKSVDIPRRRMKSTEFHRKFPSRNENDNNLRRVRSDNLEQSKRDDPSVRRSIFGHYFNEQPRSNSAPHLQRGQAPPQIPIILQQQETSRPYKRSSMSSIGSSPLLQSTPEENEDQLAHNVSRRHHIHGHPSTQAHPVDYRVFAPSEQQVAESAICHRYRELNREHQQDYDSLLERQVQIERSLPPFPSPLVRFCSETTATVAEHEACSSRKNQPDSRSYFASPDGEMHYHGVYSLLKPCSILKASRYSPNKTLTTANEVSITHSTPMIDSNNHLTTKSEIEIMDHHLSVPLSSSLNFPRSYIESAAILNQFSSATIDTGLISDIGSQGEEEKKETDSPFKGTSSAPDVLLLSNKVISECSRSNTNISGIAATIGLVAKEYCNNDSKDTSENLQALHKNKQHCRFDPRVTVTEFEDPVPRKWYHDSELDQHKREAIALAQAYLRKHPVVAEWYRRAVLDPVTKTHRKRALYSLPVFSSTYNGRHTAPSPEITTDIENLEEGLTKTFRSPSVASQQRKSSTVAIKKILVVHPNPKIASLFCKSMKSMFSAAKLVSTGSPEEASRLIQQSFVPPNHGSPSSSAQFDIIIVEQHLTRADTSSKCSKLDGILKNPLGFCNIVMKDDDESLSPETSPTSCAIRCGSDLIHLIHELSSHNNNSDQYEPTTPTSFLIGVSMRPKHDAPLLKRAGADIVWGIPIPKVGNALRSKLVAGLLAKRSSSLPSAPPFTP